MAVKKNLVKARTTTTGTGTVTLQAVTGWALFGAAYADGQVVPYAIENGDNREVGLGTVGAGNTLARTTVLATLTGGVYDDTAPAPISLTGESVVHSGPLAELFTAAEIAFTPAGSIAATTVQAAIAELDADKGVANGYASLDAGAKVPLAQLPTGTSGAVLPLLNAANTHVSGQVIELSDDGAGAGPSAILSRLSASPVAADYLGYLMFQGRNSAPANYEYAAVTARITNPAAGSEGGELALRSTVAGSSGDRLRVGVGIYTPNATGGDKGADTINAAAVYDDNVLLTCYVIEALYKGAVDQATWDARTPDRIIEAQAEQVEMRPVMQTVLRKRRERDGARIVERMVPVEEPVYDLLPVQDEAGDPILKDGVPVLERVPRMAPVVTRPAQPAKVEVRTHEPAARFAARAGVLLDARQYADFWRTNRHLPAMPSPAEWEAAGQKMATGDLIQRLWETVECQAVHIEELRTRIVALGG